MATALLGRLPWLEEKDLHIPLIRISTTKDHHIAHSRHLPRPTAALPTTIRVATEISCDP
jgi:hypothetical protein